MSEWELRLENASEVSGKQTRNKNRNRPTHDNSFMAAPLVLCNSYTLKYVTFATPCISKDQPEEVCSGLNNVADMLGRSQ